MDLLKKFGATLKPFCDFRVWLLGLICLAVGYVVDPTATFGLAGYLAYVIGMCAAALLLAKVMTPYIRMSALYYQALNGNRAAAAVLVARVALMVAILLCLMLWGK